MRPRFVITILLFALAVLALVLWLRPKPTASSITTSMQSARPPASQTTQQSANPAANVIKSNASPTVVNPVIVSNNMVEARELQMKQAVEGQNVPVLFYGKVIDQDSNALAGVRVTLGVRHSVYAIPNSLESAKYAAMAHVELEKILNPTTEVISDSNGRFEWTDSNVTGDILGVGSLKKDGYESEPGQYSCGAGSGNYNNPVVFKMWSTNIHEKLIIGNKSYEIVPDGRPYFVDLATGTISESGTKDLKIWIQYTNQVVQGQLYDWSAGIEVINGGLLEMPSGTVMYEAPIDGYVPTFQLKGQIRGGQRGNIGDRQFYIKLRNGQEYGRMSIGLYAPFNNQTPGLIRLSYTINPSGSKILR